MYGPFCVLHCRSPMGIQYALVLSATTPNPNGTINSASNASDGIVSAIRLVVNVNDDTTGSRYTVTAISRATTVPTSTVWKAREAC